MKRSLFLIIAAGLILLLLNNLKVFKTANSLVTNLTNPIQISFYAASRSLSAQFGTLLEIGSLRRNNADLESKVADLEAQNALLIKLGLENDDLKAQLGVTLGVKISLLPAPVLGFTPLATRNRLNLARGSQDNVSPGQIVIYKDILLGRIDQVSPKTSTAQLLSDPNAKVLAETQSKAKGIVIGEFGSKIKLTKVLLEEKLGLGDFVYTAGEETFPKGLVIGKITRVSRFESELFQEAEIDPLLDVGKLEMVFIRSL